MKHSTMYLYGCSPWWFIWMPYYFALKFKIYRTKVMKREIRYLVDYLKIKGDIYKQLVVRYQNIEKAKEFNEQLLEEIKDEL